MVIAIVTILAVIILPNAFKMVENIKISRVVAEVRTIKAAGYAYYAATGDWPKAVAGKWHVLYLGEYLDGKAVETVYLATEMGVQFVLRYGDIGYFSTVERGGWNCIKLKIIWKKRS